MALRYLLDTNILSDLVRRPRGPVAERIYVVGEEAVCTSVIVAAELRYGAAMAESSRLAERVDVLLSVLGILPLELPVDQYYAEIRHSLAKRGMPIGPNDLLIAAHAMAAGLTLVTANTREFDRIQSLQIENWLPE